MPNYPIVGVHKKDKFMVQFTASNFGIVIASSERTGNTATGSEDSFNENDFKIIWEYPS